MSGRQTGLPHPALVALNRFGYGAQAHASVSLKQIAADPRGFVLQDIARPGAGLMARAGLPSTSERMAVFYNYREMVRAAREKRSFDIENNRVVETQSAKPDSGMQAQMQPTPENSNGAGVPNEALRAYREEVTARFQQAAMAPVGFAERLVAFWSNHFCISASRAQPVRIMAGAYEREVIRPHVLGRFANMLRAAEQHPAMIFYLDNHISIGPNSRAGRNRGRGLNENLAREILELHTLGVNGGYTQADVSALARMITGWTMVGRQGRLGVPGEFVYNANAHEPGAQTMLGKVYPDTGVSQGEQALDDLARHHSTARFIATKFARHFIGDEPPPALVAKLADVFRSSDGDLRALAFALVNSDEAWSAPLTKIRSPWDYLVAVARVFAIGEQQTRGFWGMLYQLGQPVWTPPGPNGFPDINSHWASAKGMKTRLDLSVFFARRYAPRFEPRAMLENFAGEAASPETRRAIAGAESREQGLAIALMSPEFQRR